MLDTVHDIANFCVQHDYQPMFTILCANLYKFIAKCYFFFAAFFPTFFSSFLF